MQTASFIAEARRRAARRRGRRRDAAQVREPARSSSQILGYTGPVSAEQLVDLKANGYLPDDLIGKRRHRGDVRGSSSAAPTASQTVERTPRAAKIQVLADRRPGGRGRLAPAHDRHPRAGARPAGAPVGDEGGRPQARRRHRDEPADRRDPGDGQPARPMTTTRSPAGSAARTTRPCSTNPNKPLLNHAISDALPARVHVQARAGTGALADHKITPTTRIKTAAYLTLGGDEVPGLEPARLRAVQHQLRVRPLERHVLLPGSRASSASTGSRYWARQYGFGAPTGIDLPGEVSGHRPDEPVEAGRHSAMPIFPGEVYQAGIGQGYDVVTPIQLINAYARSRTAASCTSRSSSVRSSGRTATSSGPSSRS